MNYLPNKDDNPWLHGTTCKCGGRIGLVMYNYYGSYRNMDYECDRCNKSQRWTCGPRYSEMD